MKEQTANPKLTYGDATRKVIETHRALAERYDREQNESTEIRATEIVSTRER